MTYPLNNGVNVFITAHFSTHKLVTKKVNLFPFCEDTEMYVFCLHPVSGVGQQG